MLETWIMDLRYSARRLLRRPLYAGLAVLTLALGAGGTAAIVSIVRTLLVDPLPFAREGDVGIFWADGDWNEAEILLLRTHTPGFHGLAGYRPDDGTLEVAGEAVRFVRGSRVTAGLFDVLGAPPLLGRTFRPGDDVLGSEPTVVLSHSLWQELGGHERVLGQQLQLGGVARTVIGVMPSGFWFPSPEIRMWLSANVNPENRAGWYTLVGRVAPGSSMQAMDGPLQSIAARLGETFQYPPQWDKTRSPSITPVREFIVGDVRPAVVATLVAMALILLIACVNVAALMLAQVSGRATELSVRSALGANRGRLAQQLLFESLLVGLAAGAAGAAIAASCFHVLVRSLSLGALAEAATLDWTLFAAAIAVALLAGAGIAVVPALALWRGDLNRTLVATRTGGIASRGERLDGALVVAQVALAVLLGSGAMLVMRSVGNLRGLDPGFDVAGAIVAEATMPTRLGAQGRYQAGQDGIAALRALPGVTAAAVTQKYPLTGSGDNWGIRVEGRPDLPPSTTAFRVVTRDYFEAIRARVLRGRVFDASDREGTERSVVINDALALKYFPGEDPIGRRIYTFNDDGERIIGVIADMAEVNLTDAPTPARYLVEDQVRMPNPSMAFVVRAASPEAVAGLLQPVRAALRDGVPQIAVQRVAPMQAIFDTALGPAGELVTLLLLLAGIALILGAIGVYGAIAHFVARRTRDYGICIALGLRPSRIVLQVVRRGVMLVAMGSVIGLALAFSLTGLLSSLLYGVEPTDPRALAGAVVALFVTGALAALIPAWRASLTDPAVVLRQG